MKHREFALCRLRTEAGLEGFAFVYTRDGPIAAIVRRNIAPIYVGQQYDDPARCTGRRPGATTRSSPSGIGLRALSLVDLAAWDLAARAAGQSITAYLGGERRPMPVTAIIGYPPTLTPGEVAARSRSCSRRAGAASSSRSPRRPKRPVPACARRVRRWAPTAGSGWTATGSSRRPQDAIEFARSIEDVGLGWMEDIVPPGNARMVAEIRERRAGADRDGRRAGRLVPSRVDPGPRRGRRRAHRRHDVRRHHPAARDDHADRGARDRLRAAHVRARPLSGLRRARLRRADRVGRSGHRRRPVRRLAPPARCQRRR